MPLRRFLASAVALTITAAPAGTARPRSHPLGHPWAGALADAVQLPASGSHFFSWDPVLRRSPDRPWRRYGTERLVRLVLRVIDPYAAAHSRAPRVGIGDLSRPHGGDFGVRYGWPGHVSHQNGLDVDIYYPRRDRRERPPNSPAQINRPLAQELVNRFVRAGAIRVFVGPRTALTGPRRVVQVLAQHDNHLHVRIATPPPQWRLLGRLQEGRPIRIAERGNPHATRILVVGCIHGNECAGRAIIHLLARMPEPQAMAFGSPPGPSERLVILSELLQPGVLDRRIAKRKEGNHMTHSHKTFWIGGGLVALAVLIAVLVLVYSGGGGGGY
jgi:hypothetical protein